MTYFTPNARQIGRFIGLLRERSITAGAPSAVYDSLYMPSYMEDQYGGSTLSAGRQPSANQYWAAFAPWFRASQQLNGVETLVYAKTGSRALPGNIATGPTVLDGTVLSIFLEAGEGRIAVALPPMDWNPQEGDAPNSDSDLIVTPLTGWAEGYAEVQPAPHLMESLPLGVRNNARRTIVMSQSATRGYINADGQFRTAQQPAEGVPTAETLITEARTRYREEIRMRLGRGVQSDTAEFERKRAEHREKTAKNFEAFVRDREKDTDQHINKLPFVPHGLASSRRWGIEVESGGARGVATPENWDAKGDGSLRSAYDGYVEVQDFEPFDEEVTERVHWENCENWARHNPSAEVYDSDSDMYIRTIREDYIDPRNCEHCGNVTRTVHREPQTITHGARSGDCREFVSPILTSMHSNGLEALTTALSKNPQNDSAGVHVHVEASDLTKQQIAIMVYGYDILEPILEASYRRSRRDFCERRDVNEVLQAARKATSDGVTGNEGGRYRTLNTHSLSNHGTLEFRAMGPVYEYDYLIRWAMLCRELVNSVANGAQTKDFAKIKNWDDLTAFLAKFGKEYIRAAVYEMSGEVGEAAKLEKAGEPVTTEALDTDLRNLLAGIYNVDEAFRGMARTISAVGATIDTANLAMVGATSEI